MSGFETQVSGKWILAGEHAVLRGCPALVFPLRSRTLQLKYLDNSQELNLDLQGEHGKELQLLFWGVVEKACELKKIRRSQFSGQILMGSSIPIGAGLGASAALSVAVTRWLAYEKVVQTDEIYDFARELENLFHGESSGVDIAVAHSGKGLLFVRGGERKVFEPTWSPRWYVSYSGKRGVTIDCVNKVKALIAKDPQRGAEIDQNMKKSVQMSQQALQDTPAQGLPLLKQAIDLAGSCFLDWGLVEGEPQQHLDWLKASGAIAVKPTGSGNGGYALSLWDREPSPEVAAQLIPCF